MVCVASSYLENRERRNDHFSSTYFLGEMGKRQERQSYILDDVRADLGDPYVSNSKCVSIGGLHCDVPLAMLGTLFFRA
jgi:hypothetical protein